MKCFLYEYLKYLIFAITHIQRFIFEGLLYIRFILHLFSISELLRDNPIVATGETLKLNCTLFNYTDQNNAYHIYFYWEGETVDSKYVHVLSNSTAQVRLPNMKRSYTEHHIYCYLQGVDYRIGQQAVTVAGRHFLECMVQLLAL